MNQKVQMLPRFLGEEGSRHFTLQFSCGAAPRAHIVYVPPFGEEMNRCRAHVAAQARAFAGNGYYCTLLDFYGTGDSEGELQDASWACWLDNLHTTVRTLVAEQPVPVILWGARLGALISADYVRNYCDSAEGKHDGHAAADGVVIDSLLFWQPVTSGKRYLTQLLRQRVASLVNSGQPAESTAQIREQIASGQSVEIAGYVVGDPLMSDIEKLAFGTEALHCPHIHWLENVEQDGDELGTASTKAVTALRNAGSAVHVHPFTGPPIWQLHKRDNAQTLLELTTSLYN